MTLDLAKRVSRLLSRRNVRVFLTREDDVNLEGVTRANVARFNGADIFLSIHFNGDSNRRTRGTETFVRAIRNGNVNRDEDLALANRINRAVSQDRGVKDDTQTKPKSLAVLSDASLGNTANSHPTRACLVEVEFITNPDVDRLFNTDTNRNAFRQRLANAISNAIIEDLRNQP
jgi:N-acetylmuramoyl-L-alanine amidase